MSLLDPPQTGETISLGQVSNDVVANAGSEDGTAGNHGHTAENGESSTEVDANNAASPATNAGDGDDNTPLVDENSSDDGPSDIDLRNAVDEIVRGADLDTTTPNTIIATLSERFGRDMKPRKKVIKQFINDILNELEQEEEQEESEHEMEDEKSGVVKNFRVKRHLIVMSDKLAEFVGDRTMTRGDVVRHLWKYIRANNLQNPADRRQIIFDEQLQNLFGVRGASMFKMTALLNKHIFVAADIYTATPSPKATVMAVKRKEVKEAKQKVAAKANKTKEKIEKTKMLTKRGPNKAVICVSPVLARIVGCKMLTRPKAVKRIWAHIKKYDLQIPTDRRSVQCDEKLMTFTGQPVVTIFEIPKILQKHVFPLSHMANIDYGDLVEFYDPITDTEYEPGTLPPSAGYVCDPSEVDIYESEELDGLYD